MKPPVPLTSYALLFASMSLVGSYVALSKPLVAALPVFLLAWLRFGIGAVAMARHTRRQALTQLDLPTWRALFLQSFFGNFLFTVCMLNGIARTSVTAGGMILASLPAAVALFSWLLLRERLNSRTLVAVALAAAGIATLAFAKGPGGHALLAGNLLMLGAVCCEALYIVIGKSLASRLPALSVSALINLIGLALTTPFGLWQAIHFDFAAIGPGLWILLVFYALGASVFSVWLWMSGLKRVPANHAGVFTIALPLASTTIGVLFLGEHLAAAHAVAFACAVVGILLTTRQPSPG